MGKPVKCSYTMMSISLIVREAAGVVFLRIVSRARRIRKTGQGNSFSLCEPSRDFKGIKKLHHGSSAEMGNAKTSSKAGRGRLKGSAGKDHTGEPWGQM